MVGELIGAFHPTSPCRRYRWGGFGNAQANQQRDQRDGCARRDALSQPKQNLEELGHNWLDTGHPEGCRGCAERLLAAGLQTD